MKKFYSMLVCASVVMAASAQTATLKAYQPVEKKAVKTEQADNNFRTMTKVNRNAELLQPTTKATAPKEAAATSGPVGFYIIGSTNELSGARYTGETEVTQGSSSSSLIFNFPFLNNSNVLSMQLTATYISAVTDRENITFNLSKQTSSFTGWDIKFKEWDDDAEDYKDITSIKAMYADGVITFNQDYAIALQNASGNYATLFDMISMKSFDPTVDTNEGWTSVGNATMIDPWIIPAFSFKDGSDQYDYPYEVELQQNDTDENLYRLVDPYRGNYPLINYNYSVEQHGYIVFSIADPDHVVFYSEQAGFANPNLGISELYCLNQLGSLYEEMEGEFTPAYIVQVLGEDGMAYTKCVDGVITLGTALVDKTDSQGNPTGEKVTQTDANFGIQGDTTGGYGWQGGNMTGAIYFPGKYDDGSGVNGIVTDKNADAPVEYFNLQGVKLNNPQAGQVVIRRQGSDVTKMIAR